MKKLIIVSLLGFSTLVLNFRYLVSSSEARGVSRKMELIAKDMTFVAPLQIDRTAVNPTLKLKRGERIDFIFRNEDPGVIHDLRIRFLGIQSSKLSYGESEQFSVTVPNWVGTDVYVCSLHKTMMKGSIVIE